MSSPHRALDPETVAIELRYLLGGERGMQTASSTDAHGTPCIDVADEHWLQAAGYLRDSLGLDFIDWLSAVDTPDADPSGVQVVLHVADSRARGGPAVRRLLMRTQLSEERLRVASLTSLWPGVAWHERETFEMFGVDFEGFDDGTGLGLRPLLLPDGFEGTPLRKSFVLAARASKPWPGAKEPGESDAHAAPARRRNVPPGVPDPDQWGPRA